MLDQAPYYLILLSIFYFFFKLKRVEVGLNQKLMTPKEMMQ
jgi:hypothetical protein